MDSDLVSLLCQLMILRSETIKDMYHKIRDSESEILWLQESAMVLMC